MTKPIIHVVGGALAYASWLDYSKLTSNPDDMPDADLVMFTGGADVSPVLYNHATHNTTRPNFERDRSEMLQFRRAKQLGIPCLGICRGAQFLCVMAGGVLVQHQENPGDTHFNRNCFGTSNYVTSDHHQAQYPWVISGKEDYSVIAWSKAASRYHLSGDNKEMVNGIIQDDIEVEDCYYDSISSLAIQSHPEWATSRFESSQVLAECVKFYKGLVDMLMERRLFDRLHDKTTKCPTL